MRKWSWKDVSKDSLAILIGAVMVFVETWLIGLFAAYYIPSETYKASLTTWDAHLVPIGLTLAICAVPCMLAAFLVSLIRPRRFMYYGWFVMIFPLGDTLRAWWGSTNYGIPFSDYVILNQTVNLLLFPFFLWLFYLSSVSALRAQNEA